MSEEVKEILESLDKMAKAEYYPEELLTYKECKVLLDYITNLQKENKHLSKSYAEAILFNQKRCEQNKELQKENEKLKKLHNEELYRRIKAHKYIFKNMICDPLYKGSKVDGENVINILKFLYFFCDYLNSFPFQIFGFYSYL